MDINQMECCAMNELSGLSDYDTPQDVMIDICRNYVYYNDKNRLEVFPGFIVFSALVKVGAREEKQKYGEDFAKFIKDNKLGAVTDPIAGKNRINHPDHTVKAWIWTPAMSSVRAWWKKNKPENTSKKSYYDDENDGGW